MNANCHHREFSCPTGLFRRMRSPDALLTFATLCLSGCGPLVPESTFLELASNTALNPYKTCDELKVEFDVPQLITVDNPGQAGLNYEETYVYNAAGVPLRVWVLTPDQPLGTVVFSNGAVGEMPCYLLIAKGVYDAGYEFVMYDFQGFGGSGGSPDLASLYGDLDAVLDWTFARPGAYQVTLMGVSIGTIPSVAQAAARPSDVNGLVLDGLISLDEEVKRFQFLFAWRPAAYYSKFDDVLRVETQVPNLHVIALDFVYGQDEYATSAHAREILAASPVPTSFADFPELKHARGPYLATDEYFDRLLAYLDSIWTIAVE